MFCLNLSQSPSASQNQSRNKLLLAWRHIRLETNENIGSAVDLYASELEVEFLD